MSENYYVALTGSKNNAGDYLIKKRAFELLRWLRPDREVIDYNAWEGITDEKLEIINRSKALLFLGGPALRKDMFSNIYKIADLTKIRVPMLSFAIGWKSHSGDWRDSRSYPLQESTLELISIAEQKKLKWSVRDYTSLNAISAKGVSGAVMTGCAALYRKDFIGSAMDLKPLSQVKKVSFSLGVGFRSDARLDKQQKALLLTLKSFFAGAKFTAVFHHGISENYSTSEGANTKLLKDHQKLAEWLKQNNIDFVDISGSAENLEDHYQEADFHIGYRVHAHIFMSSISKMSVLINEDGRGKGLAQVVPGLYFDSFETTRQNKNLQARIIARLRGKSKQQIDVYDRLDKEIAQHLKYEFDHNFPRISRTRSAIDELFPVMQDFIRQLP